MNVEIGRQNIIILFWKSQGHAVSFLGIHKSEHIYHEFSPALICDAQPPQLVHLPLVQCTLTAHSVALNYFNTPFNSCHSDLLIQPPSALPLALFTYNCNPHSPNRKNRLAKTKNRLHVKVSDGLDKLIKKNNVMKIGKIHKFISVNFSSFLKY